MNGRIDLGQLAAEFLALGLDPYPRKPGVEFAPVVEDFPVALRRSGQLKKTDPRGLSAGRACQRPRKSYCPALLREPVIIGVWRGMEKPVRIALDAMGGDFGPSVVVPGAALFLERFPDVEFLMFGDQEKIAPLLKAQPRLAALTQVRHTSVAVGMADKPSQALRAGRRNSSMWKAIEAVRNGEADCAISSGNTGALMAMSKICLRTMAQIDRPALAALWPTLRGRSIVLDVGATIGADAQHYVDLAIMGAAMARSLFELERPTVGLLNVGVEEVKGIEEVKAASRLLQGIDSPLLDYRGFVEGDDIGRGAVDVVVTEGFSGNIALKTAEGTVKQIRSYLKQSLTRSWMTKLGALSGARRLRGSQSQAVAARNHRRRVPRPRRRGHQGAWRPGRRRLLGRHRAWQQHGPPRPARQDSRHDGPRQRARSRARRRPADHSGRQARRSREARYGMINTMKNAKGRDK